MRARCAHHIKETRRQHDTQTVLHGGAAMTGIGERDRQTILCTACVQRRHAFTKALVRFESCEEYYASPSGSCCTRIASLASRRTTSLHEPGKALTTGSSRPRTCHLLKRRRSSIAVLFAHRALDKVWTRTLEADADEIAQKPTDVMAMPGGTRNIFVTSVRNLAR